MKYSSFLLILLILTSCTKEFDKQVWIKSSNDDPENPRYHMIEDLKKNYLRIGMSSEQVYNLLGQARYIDTNKLGIQWTYPIGSNPGMHIDPFSLVIEFDSVNEMTGTEIIKH